MRELLAQRQQHLRKLVSGSGSIRNSGGAAVVAALGRCATGAGGNGSHDQREGV
eukprot:COSAG06_NODE_19091_length_854_cov_0.785430_1_plen_53_part_10